MELVQLGAKTYYIKNNTNIGIYKIDEKNVYLIDTGNDKDAGKKILKILDEQEWTCKGVILTHSHADHMGGAKLIQDRTNCQVLAHNIETCFAKYPVLEPSLLYGAYPLKDLQNKFLMAKETNTLEVEDNLPEGLEMLTLKGHTFDMIGIKTSDNIYFLGDALLSEETITKYHLFYLYNVKEFLNTLEYLSTLKGHFYIPSHIEGTSNIKDLITAIHNAGGIAVLAHPACCWALSHDHFVKKLISYGLDGIEVFYPYKRHRGIVKFTTVHNIEKIADKYGLIKTGGTDLHDDNL